MLNKTVIIDYGMGNLRSVQKKFLRVGANVEITNNVGTIAKADKLVLPGVGHFANGVKKLKESGIWNVLNERVIMEKVPIFGICLGMQLMSKHSEEGNIEGFNWINAKVKRFIMNDQLRYKVPHMGWNNIKIRKDSKLFENIPEEAMFYFVHSYHLSCNNQKDVLTTSNYEHQFASSIQADNIFGTQFHPEKSHDWGEIVFRNFISL